jgi:hypothetical protein
MPTAVRESRQIFDVSARAAGREAAGKGEKNCKGADEMADAAPRP